MIVSRTICHLADNQVVMMKKLTQTRLHDPPNSFGNCFSAVIACIMGKDSAEDVIQIQDYYDDEKVNSWIWVLRDWLKKHGYIWYDLKGHLMTGEYYLVTGKTERNTVHICIYKNGKLYHDPHPSNKGLTEIMNFEYIGKI